MKKNIYIINYNNINYIFLGNNVLKEKIDRKVELLEEDLKKYKYDTDNIKYLNSLIRSGNNVLINYDILGDTTIYKLKYLINKYVDEKLMLDEQHLMINTDINYGEIQEELFKMYSKLNEVNSEKIVNYYKLLGFKIIGNISNIMISYKNLKKHLEWNSKVKITLGIELININNNIELYFDGEFNNKNVEPYIFELFIYYNTHNRTLNEFNISNNKIYLYNYYYNNNYKINISKLLNGKKLDYKEDNILLANSKSLGEINLIDSDIEYYELIYNNRFNNVNINSTFNNVELSDNIPFIKIKDKKSEYGYKIYIDKNNDIPYIEEDILNIWVDNNDNMRVNMVQMKVKYLENDNYYDIYISNHIVKFIFSDTNLGIKDINNNVNSTLKSILGVSYVYNIMNPLFNVRKIQMKYNYTINDINYKNIYYRLLFLLLIDYENNMMNIDYIRKNINKTHVIKTLLFNYKNSINYIYPIDEMNILRDAMTFTTRNKIIEEFQEKNIDELMIKIYDKGIKKILCEIEYNNNIFDIKLENITNYKKIYDVMILLNNKLNVLMNDKNIKYLYKNFDIKKMGNYDMNLYNNNLEESLFIYKQFIDNIYNKLNLSEDVVDNIDDDFFADLEDIEEDVVVEYRELEEYKKILKDIIKNKGELVVLNINNGEYKYSSFPKKYLLYLGVKSNNKNNYKLSLKNFDNYKFEILICIIHYSILFKNKFKMKNITFVQIINSQILNLLNNVKIYINNIEETIETIVKIIDYINELDIKIVKELKFNYLDKNMVEIYLMLLDYEYISNKNIKRYNKNIYKKLGFLNYNQYSQHCPLDRQPSTINKELYNILLENDETGSVNRIFNNDLLTKKISNEYYLCLINNLQQNNNLLPIITNITEDTNIICCHSFDYKQKRKINIKSIDEVKLIEFSNNYMFPYNIGNIPADDIVKSLGYNINKQKHIKAIYDTSVLLRVGIPINSVFSPFINSVLFVLNKMNMTKGEFMNELKLNITNKIFKSLNNGSLYYIFKKKIVDKTISLSSLINTYMTNSLLQDEIKDPYMNFVNYIENNLKYIDYDIGLHLLSEIFNVNIVIFSYNFTNIVFHELLCPVPNLNYDFDKKDTIILLKLNNIYEVILSYNYFSKYNNLFSMNDKYFKKHNLNKLLSKCKLKDNNIIIYNAYNYENPINKSLNNKDIGKLKIKYNVVDNYTIVGIIESSENIFLPINILIDNIKLEDNKKIEFDKVLDKDNKYIYNYSKTLNKLNNLVKNNIISNKLSFDNKVILDNMMPSYINGIVLMNGGVIPIILTKITSITLKDIKLIENDELYINNIIRNNKYNKEIIDNNKVQKYMNFKVILNNLFKNNKLNKDFRNILLKNDILNIYDYLSKVLKENNINVEDKIFVEYISYEILNNYITRYDILDKNIVNDISINMKDNILYLSENNLKTIGISNIYKSFYYKNNNLYTGNILNDKDINIYPNIVCNNKELIEDINMVLNGYSYYSLKFVNNSNIVSYSECIYYNLEKILKTTNLRGKIFEYIKENDLLKIYIDNIRKELNDINYMDIYTYDNLEEVITTSNHWITFEDLTLLTSILKINIIVINTLNNIKIIKNIDSDKYIIIYEYLLYNKKIYYLVCKDDIDIFDNKILKKLTINIEQQITEYDTTEQTKTMITNQYLYNIETDKFTIINLLVDNIILDFDINDIFNEIIMVWKNLPFNYSNKFLDILDKLNNNIKITNKMFYEIRKNYPNIEINEPIIFPPFYHLDNVWNLRQNKQIYNIFTEIYENSKLLVRYESVSIIIEKTQYFKTYNNKNNNEKIYGFICLSPVILSYINNKEYINYLFQKSDITEINYDDRNEYRIDNKNIDKKYVETIKLDKGLLYIFSESLLYNLDINNNMIGYLVDISYFPEELYDYNKKMRIKSYESGMSLKNNFILTHYDKIDINRVFNYFVLDLYKDKGVYLYNNYKDFKPYSPIVYNKFIKQLNEYEPSKILVKYMNKYNIVLNKLLADKSIYNLENIVVSTLYDNNKSYKNLDKLGINLVEGWN